jgi:hypothetical protein
MRRSGPESTNTVVPPARTKTDDLSLRLRGSSEVQTAQPQPITGTPTDVPVPRNVNETSATAVILHVTRWQATIGSPKIMRSTHRREFAQYAFSACGMNFPLQSL